MGNANWTDQEFRILDYVKDSLGMTLSDKEKFLETNINASIQAVRGRIGPDAAFYVDNFIYELAVAELAVNNYMNRSASTDVNLYRTEYGFSEYILDLKADYALWTKKHEVGDLDGKA